MGGGEKGAKAILKDKFRLNSRKLLSKIEEQYTGEYSSVFLLHIL
jgi:hypothetical protein